MKLRFIILANLLWMAIFPLFGKTAEKSNGDFVMQMSDSVGSFNFYYLGINNSRTDFFVPYDSFSNTFFSVKFGNTVYKLRNDTVNSVFMEETTTGIKLKYVVNDRFEAVLDCSFMDLKLQPTQSIVKVQVSVKNISDKSERCEIKGTFDTLLGESTGVHFSTARLSKVNTETNFTSMRDDQWIRSSNGNESIQFLLDGADITSPRLVAVANKDVLIGNSWEPSLKVGRTFNSVFSYNNSAFCVLWDSKVLSPIQNDTITFYISLSSKSVLPSTTLVLTETPKTYYGGREIVSESGDFDNPEDYYRYAEAALKRYEELKAHPETASKEEITRLRTEIDAIIEKLRWL